MERERLLALVNDSVSSFRLAAGSLWHWCFREDASIQYLVDWCKEAVYALKSWEVRDIKMSYNTRRLAGQAMGGIGRGSTQGMYQQPRSTAPNTRSFSSQQQVGYGNNQRGQNPQSYQPNQYQAVPPPLHQQKVQQSPSPPQPQPQEPQITKQESSNLQQEQKEEIGQQQEQQPTPDQTETCGVKTESVTAEPSDNTDIGDKEIPLEQSAPQEESAPKTRPWHKKRTPGFKVNKKLRRWRQNARLRKILQPKNAIMVLNELNAGIKFSFQEHTNALTQTMFVVNAEVDGKNYVGQGLSKPLAKQNAAENALKALLLGKMADAQAKADSVKQPESMEVDSSQPEPNNGAGSGDSAGGSDVEGNGAGPSGKEPAVEDDVPWGSLASFALYKLFTEWQNQGTHVPIAKHQCPTPSLLTPQPQNVSGTPSPMKKIPDNPTERHPVMLLNQLIPGVQFFEVNRVGVPPNLTFTMGVSVEGKQYEGVAKSKKEAKKEAAISALAGALDIHYTK